MTSKWSKRPSSARRNIKQETFSPFVSCSRLRQVQSLLSCTSTGDSNKADGLLVIVGIDSRGSTAASELVSYLLFNFFSCRQVELEKSGYPEEVLDDLMFLIRRDAVDVYCNPINYRYLLPYVAHWPNLHIHCLDDAQYENDDRAEEFKIHSLVSMVDGCHNIAVPFATNGEHAKFSSMLIEKWPIIQAFALDDFGGRGFFTMKHQVFDMGAPLQNVYHLLDPVAVETLVTEQLPQFEKQWSSLAANVDLQIRSSGSDLTEGSVCEPLKSYYLHGRKTNAGIISVSRRPFVLFGTNTCRSVLGSARHIGIESDAGTLTTGVGGGVALHMVCQAVCPQASLICLRTYFLCTDFSANTGHIGGPDCEETNLQRLVLVYDACVAAVMAAIQVYCRTLCPTQAEDEARRVLVTKCKEGNTNISAAHLQNNKLVEFTLEAIDSENRPVALSDRHAPLLARFITVTVYDIASVSRPESSLGSISYGETFIASRLRLSHPDGSISMDSSHVILTEHIPQFISWPFARCERDLYMTLKGQLGDSNRRALSPEDETANTEQTISHTICLLGKLLCKTNTAGLVSEKVTVTDGELTLWENGLSYVHIHHGLLILRRSDLDSIRVYDGGAPGAVALLLVQYSEEARSRVPVHFRSPGGAIVLPVAPKTRFHQQFFREVLPTWRNDDRLPQVTAITELTDQLCLIHQQLQREQQLLTAPADCFKKAKVQLPSLESFLSHFAVSSISDQPLPSMHLPAVLGQSCDLGSFESDNNLVVTVIGGVPGGHQGRLCAVLKQTSQYTAHQCAVIEFDSGSPGDLQGALAAVQSEADGVTRVIVLATGFTDIVTVVQTILCHPEPQVAKRLAIGAVTVCVNSRNTFLRDHYTWPKLLDQCAQGWVNNILLTDTTEEVVSERVQRLLRAVNSDVAFLLAKDGEVTRSPDLDLILSTTAFDEASCVRARHLSHPGWGCGAETCNQGVPVVDEITITFSQPLLKNKLIGQIKALKSKQHNPPFSGHFYYLKGIVKFTDCPDQRYDLTASVLTADVRLARVRQGAPPGCRVTFSGFRLDAAQLRTWLRSCAPLKPEKKMYRTRDSLTKKEVECVHKENHLRPPPAGWFYNGSHFVSLSGEKSDQHPELETFLSLYLEKVNAEVDQHNERISELHYHDLFD